MARRGGRTGVARWAAVALLAALPARGAEIRSTLQAIGQVREGDQSRQQEAPVDLYSNIGGTLHYGSSFDTYSRLEQDLSRNESATQLLQGSLRIPFRGVDATAGRLFISEVPGGTYITDGARVRLNTGGPLVVSAFGGEPQYFEPTYSSPSLSQNERIFGGSVRTANWKGGSLSLGYLQLYRRGEELRQLVSATGGRAFSSVPGQPSLYGMMAYDADHQNIDNGRAGMNVFLSQPRLMLNVESNYYKPQDAGTDKVAPLNRREDSVFQTFSVSDLLQFRGGLRYMLTKTVSAFGDYSYQNYEALSGNTQDGHVGGAGVLWLPGGDGLEVVRVEYYVTDAAKGGTVNGGKVYYENRVYDRILFRSHIDIAGYSLQSNQSDTAVNGLVGVGYQLRPGLVAETNLMGGRNERFDSDIRFGFFVTYNFGYRPPWPGPRQDGQRRGYSELPEAGRPTPWGFPKFGPAAWKPATVETGS